ncbi:MAG: pyridoxal phosphate-dependent aminotransferase [Planctomycetota bacterium]|nr:pyridoxal phosphate-dependent aminotransferase [Planctomycetota bacterium]
MTISRQVREAMQGASWIRKMFTEGQRLKKQLGADQVADLALGNPVQEPPAALAERLRELAGAEPAGHHRYMANAGLASTRDAVAAHLARHTGVPYDAAQIVMSVGAGGGLNVLFKALLDPDDEVICLTPYFVEYRFYITNHGGRMVLVPTDARFRPDPAAIRAAITPRTRAVVVNSPNNPTGVVYDTADYDALARVLTEASEAQGRPVYLISDEPYRAITYDGVSVPWPVRQYRDTIHVTSFSKDLGLPGERIGYVAVNPATPDAEALTAALTFCNRVLGFVNAPALQQRLVEGLLDVHVDMAGYVAKRGRLLAALKAAGYELVAPEGAFYMFPRVPGGMDDVEFVGLCLEERLLVVPGSGFGTPGHFRMSYAVTDRDVELAVEALQRAADRARAAQA